MKRPGKLQLGQVLRKWRLMSELDLRSVAALIGTSAATLLRIEQGRDCDGKTMMRIFRWLMNPERKSELRLQ